MKNTFTYIFAILFLSIGFYPSIVFAQKSKTPKIKQKEKSKPKPIELTDVSTDESFEAMEAPEKWKNESAVTLSQSQHFTYGKEGKKKVSESILFRKRVKLQDETAVKEFAERFYNETPEITPSHKISGVMSAMIALYKTTFATAYEVDVVFNIIKPNGEVIKVDSFDSYTKTISYVEVEAQKLIIPELEVGDIVDYAYKKRQVLRPFDTESFDTVFVKLTQDYPIVKQTIEIDLGEGISSTIKSLNGAPKFQAIVAGKQYQMMDEMRHKTSNEKWALSYRSEPAIKFQAHYSERINTEGESAEGLSVKELEVILNHKIEEASGYKHKSTLLKYINQHHPDEKNKRKLVNSIYYYFRHIVKGSESEYFTPEPPLSGWDMVGLSKAETKAAIGEQSNIQLQITEVSDLDFVKTLSEVFEELGIKASIQAAMPRFFGSVEELVSPEELTLFLKVQLKSGDVILTNFGRDTQVGDYPEALEGAQIVYQNPKLSEDASRLPSGTFKDNHTEILTTIGFNEDMDALNLTRSVSHIGKQRSRYSKDIVVSSDFLAKEYEKYPSLVEMKGSAAGKKYERENQSEEMKERKEVEKPKRLILSKSLAAKELQTKISKYKKFKLLQDGRYHTKPKLKYQEEISVEDLLQESNGTYTIEIGKFIGIQEKITEDMQGRSHDIYFPYAQSFNYEITLNTPASHTIESLESLNTSVDNETGSFISVAKLEGNQLIIEAHKAYKNSFEPKENWTKMLEFLEAAYQFSQQKVVLKKK